VTPGGTDVHAIDHDGVTRVTARHLGTTEVRDLTRLSGGASRETWAYDAVDADGSVLELILRRDPPGRAAAAVDECALLTEASRVGVAVPRVRFELDEDDGIGHGFVMDRIAGETHFSAPVGAHCHARPARKQHSQGDRVTWRASRCIFSAAENPKAART